MAITLDKILSAGTTVASLNNIVMSNANGMSIGLNSNTVTFSYTVPTDYISTAQSSLFQQTSLMSNYLGTTASLDDLADVIISSPSLNQVVKWNGANWVNGDTVAVGAGNGVVLFFDDSPSGIGGYETIATTPDTDPEVDEFVTVNNSTALIHGYALPTQIGRTIIDAGVWDFATYTYVSNTTPTSTLVFEVYSRTVGGIETLLFSAESDPITFTSVQALTFSSVQPQFIVNSTDYLVIKVYGKTTALINIDVHFVHSGTDHYSHVHTPLFPLHNDLAGLQGGVANEYYHLDAADYSNRNISATSVYQLTANMSDYQATSLMSNYLGTTYTSHTHSQYINTSQSSLFQQTSQMSDYQATSLMSNYLNTSVSSDFQATSAMSDYQQTSLMSNYLGTTYTSHTHSQYINTSVSSEFQQTSLMTNYVNTSVSSLFQQTSNTSDITSNALNTSQSSLFQQTSLMSNYLGTAATQSFRFTSADSQLQFTSGMSDYQATSLMSNYLGTAATQSFRFTSADSQLQFTSAMSNYLGTTYTSHTHSQYINTSVSSDFLTSQTVQPVAASGSNGSFAFSTLSFGNLNGLSFYTSNGSIVGSVSVSANTGIVVQGGTSTQKLDTLSFSDANGVSFGLSVSTITASVRTDYAASTHTHGNPSLFLTNISGTTASASNGLTLSLSAANPGGGVVNSYYENIPLLPGTASSLFGTGISNYMQPFILPYDISASYIRMPIVMSFGSSSANTANSTIPYGLSQSQTMFFNIYTIGTGTRSDSLGLFTSASATMAMALSVSYTASNGQTIRHSISYPVLGASSTASVSTASITNIIYIGTAALTNFTGSKQFDIPFAASLPAGEYWVGIQRSTSSSAFTQASATLSNATFQITNIGISQQNANYNLMGTTASTNGLQLGLGVFSSAGMGTGATTASIALSQISTAASQIRFPFQMIRLA